MKFAKVVLESINSGMFRTNHTIRKSILMMMNGGEAMEEVMWTEQDMILFSFENHVVARKYYEDGGMKRSWEFVCLGRNTGTNSSFVCVLIGSLGKVERNQETKF
ncbi:hypothetical protein L1987_83428 [Smallanthus sonchifolius]|uniref:Uncharacterized protein n=1 Tax=Smallanthus sonchifolius TaxID=185202 RepID=A0ACB8YD86_9ASTR|nr:hypothetical protein L1987_83428 [Smallanthus sonchifolius]